MAIPRLYMFVAFSQQIFEKQLFWAKLFYFIFLSETWPDSKIPKTISVIFLTSKSSKKKMLNLKKKFLTVFFYFKILSGRF